MNQVFTPKCSSCHEEHRGSLRLAATSDAACTQCHADLRATDGPVKFVSDIENFGPGHPEFAALRPGAVDPGTIKLNHAVHMKKNLKGPNGEPVQLDCGDCHRPPSSTDAWRFGMAAAPPAGSTSAATMSGVQLAAMPPSQKSDLASMILARAYMAPPTFAKTCAACHGLQFDKRFTDGAPHDTPEVIHAFLVQKFQKYIAAHPSEVREMVPVPGLPQRPQPVALRVVTPQQWVTERVDESERLLYGKTCKQCHSLAFSPNAAPAAALPVVAKSNITPRWLPHANFNHDRHQMLQCTECHAALTSHDTADILIPGIATCEKCHHSGANAAEARCFECHTYHDWTKMKAVKGNLALSGFNGGD
jgi:predicted CXXCH cytochrome family protein